ncbi:Permease of the drug/metabolite transporter (DMT) superfamily [Asanoa hainanensis]|uniref:Permease of the drug/metabolite transporter (DMT) superfamily n=1 Tax=Asanoa hainanensis TaxID=560556 RepID=A0A239NZM2_9ACTN|nr:DMT family transporter [Asanoa hainanensis]SNT60200.1 Permease of the drug/metabolite transporter (DMT) superfamily [Asanoa hainanensis]
MLLVVLLGLSAAVLLSVAAALQQHAAQRVAHARPARRGPLPLLGVAHRLLRSPMWLCGQVAGALGAGVQGAALHLGSVALVQPLLAAQLLFALPLGARRTRRRPRAGDWLAAAAIVGALTLFLSVRGAVPAGGHSDPDRVLLAVVLTAALAGLLVTVAARWRAGYATLLAIGGALCSALAAVLLKVTSESVAEHGVVATIRYWPLYALVGAIVGALVLGQQAFASGSLAAAVTAGSVTNPVASYLLGVLAFHAALPHGAGPRAALAGAAVLLVSGAWVLSRSPLTGSGGQLDVGPPRRADGGQHGQVLADHAGHADPPGPRQRVRRVHRPGQHGVGGPAQFLDDRLGQQPQPDRHAVHPAAAQPGAQAGQLQRVARGQDPPHVRLTGERVEHRPLLGAHRHRYARRVPPQRLGDQRCDRE